MEPLSLASRLRLLRERSLPDRPTKILHTAREAWDSIGQHQDDEVALLLVELLRDVEDLRLVRMVVPELRCGTAPPDRHLQRKVVEETSTLHSKLDNEARRTQFDFDEPYYRQEKEMLQEAEMHRLSLLLYSSNALADGEAYLVRRWMAACPLAPCDGPAAGQPCEPSDLGDAEERALREADVHVLRMLLFSGRVLTQLEREAVLRWLDSCPVQVRRSKQASIQSPVADAADPNQTSP